MKGILLCLQLRGRSFRSLWLHFQSLFPFWGWYKKPMFIIVECCEPYPPLPAVGYFETMFCFLSVITGLRNHSRTWLGFLHVSSFHISFLLLLLRLPWGFSCLENSIKSLNILNFFYSKMCLSGYEHGIFIQYCWIKLLHIKIRPFTILLSYLSNVCHCDCILY